MKQKNLIGLTLPALLCTLLWGSAFPAVKSGYALFGIGDEAACKLFFAGWRFMLAGVAVLVISVITSRKLVVPTRAQWPGILLLGLVQTTVQYVFFYIGLSHTTAKVMFDFSKVYNFRGFAYRYGQRGKHDVKRRCC